MGFPIESYEFSELSRVSFEGEIAPLLFWVLPIGEWSQADLHLIWDRFTQGGQSYQKFGYVFIKDRNRRRAERGNRNQANLSFVGATLSEVLPMASRNRYRTSGPSTPKALILAGSYPQPGWGLLVDFDSRSTMDLGMNLDRLETKIDEFVKIHMNDLEIFRRVSDAFRKYTDIKDDNNRDHEKIFDLTRKLEKMEASVREINQIKDCLDTADAENLVSCCDKVIHVTSTIQNNLTNSISDLQNSCRKLRTALFVTSNGLGELQTIEPFVKESVAIDGAGRDRIISQLNGNQKKLFHMWLNAISNQIFTEHQAASDVFNWANSGLSNYAGEVKSRLNDNIASITPDLSRDIGDACRQKITLREEMERSRSAYLNCFREYQILCADAVEIQTQIAPRFLIDLESSLKRAFIPNAPISWDPARMVGWKTFNGANISLQDLKSAANELLFDYPDHPNVSSYSSLVNNNSSVDGGLFTDYVHHVITTSRGGLSPWEASAALLAKIFRSTELEKLFEQVYLNGDHGSASGDKLTMAQNLISAMGWKQESKRTRDPLRSLIKGEAGQPYHLVFGKSVLDLRISMESFCKDLMDIIVSEIRVSGDISQIIEAGLPDYRWKDPRKRWTNEVDGISVGSARLLIEFLGKMAFPDKTLLVSEISTDINRLGQKANILSHDQMDSLKEVGTPIPDPNDMASEVSKLLQHAEDLVGEMPWHMQISTSFGNCPVVLSGEAWSHGASTKKQLRVLCWKEMPRGDSEVLVWNRSRRNPVIADPVFLRRPQ